MDLIFFKTSNLIFGPILGPFGRSLPNEFFFKIPSLPIFWLYDHLSPCKKSGKTGETILRSWVANGWTNEEYQIHMTSVDAAVQ